MSRIFKKVKAMMSGKADKTEKTDKKKKVKTWKANVDYKAGDVVKYRGREYTCVLAHRSARAVTPLTAAENWEMAAPIPPAPVTPTPEPVTPTPEPVTPTPVPDSDGPVV